MTAGIEFKPVLMEDRELFAELFGKYPPEHSDYMHSIMITWAGYMMYSYGWMGDHLLIMTECCGERNLRPPVGEFELEAMERALELSKEMGCMHPFAMVGERTASWLRSEMPQLELESHRDLFDYVYLSRDLSELSGKRYLKVRNQLNRFRRENEYAVEEIDGGNIEDVRDVLKRWCIQRGCHDDPFLMHERGATMKALDNLAELGLSGLAIRIDGSVKAFTIFEEMRSDMAVIHFEKADQDIPGLYQAINQETASRLAHRYEFINREADMGLEGLRRAKMRYRPHSFMEVYHVKGW